MDFSGLFSQHGAEFAVIFLALVLGIPILALLVSLARSIILIKLPVSKALVENRHILVIGASQGLGKEFSLQIAKLGAKRVTLVARGTDGDDQGKSRLDYAVEECRAFCSSDVVVEGLKMDASDPTAVKTALTQFLTETGKVDWLVICSGSSTPELVATNLTNYSPDNEKYMMEVNYFASVNVIRTLLVLGASQTPSAFPERIVTVGSVALGCPMAGFAAYAASKGAIRTFTDVLRNEKYFYGNIKVHHFMPGSMDTPGFEEENKNKPEVTKRIEGTADLYPPSQAAQALLAGINSETYIITNDPLGFLARFNINNLTPRDWTLLEILYAPLGVILAELFYRHFDSIARQCAEEENSKKDI